MFLLRRLSIGIGCALILLAGCSNEKEDTKKQHSPVSTNTTEKSKGGEFIIQEIKKITIPNTVDEWKDLKPGLLAKNFDYEHETSEWPADVNEVKDEFIVEMKKVIKEDTDDDKLFKSLIYLLGSNIHQELINKQLSLKANFEEPYLPEPSEEKDTKSNKKNVAPSKAILLLDASSSMLLEVDGQQKMDIAKTAVRRFAKTIGAKSDVSLYVYGHTGSQEDKDKELSCTKIDEVYPLKKYEEKTFTEAVEHIQAKGWTPIAAAIKKVREDSKAYTGAITVYIVSDGAETCDGDPVKEAEEFAKRTAAHKVNIIGFNVDQKSETQLKAVAKAGNGEYLSANNTDELNQSISKKWVPPSFLDVIGKQWSSPKMSSELYKHLNTAQMNFYKIDRAAFVEKIRFQSAIQLLANEKMINEDQKNSLDEKLINYEKQLETLNNNLLEQKKQEINKDADRIDKQINDWAKRMDDLRKELDRSS